MRKIALFLFGVIILTVIVKYAGFDFFGKKQSSGKQGSFSPLNMTVKIEGDEFVLENGKAEKEIDPGSSMKNKIMIFGEPVYGDLDGDGDQDAAVLLVSSSGGTGSFYYAVLGINNGKQGYKASNTIFLGDRIAPQTIEIHDGRALFNYAIRKEGEPMSERPSIGKSFWVNFDKNTGEISELIKT